MRSVSIYYRNQPDQIKIVRSVQTLCESHDVLFIDICVDQDEELRERFGDKSPVVLAGAYRLNSPFTLSEVEVAIKATVQQDDMNPNSVNDEKRFTLSNQERFALWFSKSYAWVISVIILIFLSFSALPPVLAANGNYATANAGYKIYSFLCHQLAFRSFFINGEQYAYPRELAGIDNLKTYEDVTGRSAEDIKYARSLIGNGVMGYKLALCERDVAIYAGLGLFGLIFHFTGRKIRHLRWFYWMLLAVVPIAIDGGSQLPGLAQGWPAWMPARESSPLLRVITGSLFGIGTAWFVFPLMEESIRETRFVLERKLNISKRYAARQ